MSKIKPKFKVGDILTVFDMNKCTSTVNIPHRYYFGGHNQFGKPGKVIKVYNSTHIGKLSKKECYKLEVQFSGTGYQYAMLEDEFEEYYKDSPKITSEQDLCDLLPENWYTDKTPEIMEFLLEKFKGHPLYSTFEDQINVWGTDQDYLYIGYYKDVDEDFGYHVEIYTKDYFKSSECTYFTNEKIINKLKEPLKQLEIMDEPIKPAVKFLDLLPTCWHTDKTEETLNLFKDIFKFDQHYSCIIEEIEDYSDDPFYSFIGYEHASSCPVNINNEDYFRSIGSEYIPSEKFFELFSTTILESVVTHETQSKQFVESNISQITETREQPKSFFNF